MPASRSTSGLAAFAEFRGVKRRLEVRGTVRGITRLRRFRASSDRDRDDDRRLAPRRARCAHPRGAGAAIAHDEARHDARARCPASLAGADRVFCYASQLGWDVADALAPLGAKATVYDDIDALVDAVAAEARPGDLVLAMSNGAFGGVHDKLLQRLAEKG